MNSRNNLENIATKISPTGNRTRVFHLTPTVLALGLGDRHIMMKYTDKIKNEVCTRDSRTEYKDLQGQNK